MRFRAARSGGPRQDRFLPGYEHATDDTIDAVLEGGRQLAGRGPLARSCATATRSRHTEKRRGARRRATHVVLGGADLLFDPEFGGQGMPWLLRHRPGDVAGGQMGFGPGPAADQGAIDAIHHHGSDAQKAQYLPKMISGEWTGTMNSPSRRRARTRPAQSRAVKERDHYLVDRPEIFITYGEHDLTENIVHLVLARTPDAPAASAASRCHRAKFLPDARQAGNAQRPQMRVARSTSSHPCQPDLRHELRRRRRRGRHLVGEEGRGLSYMFTMMNNARLSVASRGWRSPSAPTSRRSLCQERVQSKDDGSPSPSLFRSSIIPTCGAC